MKQITRRELIVISKRVHIFNVRDCTNFYHCDWVCEILVL